MWTDIFGVEGAILPLPLFSSIGLFLVVIVIVAVIAIINATTLLEKAEVESQLDLWPVALSSQIRFSSVFY